MAYFRNRRSSCYRMFDMKTWQQPHFLSHTEEEFSCGQFQFAKQDVFREKKGKRAPAVVAGGGSMCPQQKPQTSCHSGGRKERRPPVKGGDGVLYAQRMVLFTVGSGYQSSLGRVGLVNSLPPFWR